jgi:hypothetical protein
LTRLEPYGGHPALVEDQFGDPVVDHPDSSSSPSAYRVPPHLLVPEIGGAKARSTKRHKINRPSRRPPEKICDRLRPQGGHPVETM